MNNFFQIPFDFPKFTSYGSENFFVSENNEDAFNFINLLPNWQTFAALIYGEIGSGKTHLAKFAMEKEPDSIMISGKDLTLGYQPENKLVIIEDIETINEEALFHLFNNLKEKGMLLLTAKKSINRLDLSLKDLKSRLLTIPEIEIMPPTDDLIFALLVKNFNDLQIDINNDGIQYILKQIERSYQAIHSLISKIDFLSRSQKRKITIPLIKEAMNY